MSKQYEVQHEPQASAAHGFAELMGLQQVTGQLLATEEPTFAEVTGVFVVRLEEIVKTKNDSSDEVPGNCRWHCRRARCHR